MTWQTCIIAYLLYSVFLVALYGLAWLAQHFDL